MISILTLDSTFHENIFTFLGLFVARGIFDFKLLDLPFSDSFLKCIKGEELTIENDLKVLYPSVYELIKQLKRLNEEEIENLFLTFTVPESNIELKENGKDLDVTKSNVDEYVKLVLSFLLKDGISKQIESFRFGFSKLIKLEKLDLFNTFEMSKLINGEQQIWNENILYNHTKCDYGYSHSTKIIQFLFQVLCEFDLEHQRLFLSFVTGSPKLPVGGLAFLKPKLTIVRKVCESNQSPDELLPSVMTCTNYLKLPEYSSKEILKIQLLKAITEGQGSFLLS
jgi:E3 ubiquitin-protein ligase TRIP12